MPEEPLIKRVAPNSLEAEQSVVGAMLIDRDAIQIAAEIVNPDDFYNRQLGTLFETMVELDREGIELFMAQSLDRSIVQIPVCHFEATG